MAVPYIISESQVQVFKFYENAAIHEAVFVNNRIMRLAGVFAADDKQSAFEVAYQLCDEYPTLLMPGQSQYRVWVDVRCIKDFAAVSKPLASSSEGRR